MTQFYSMVSQEEADMKEALKDDFFTPPPSPDGAPELDFRRAVAVQLEMLHAFLLVQYEKDMSVVRVENQNLSQRLLALESTGGLGVQSSKGSGAREPDICLQESTRDVPRSSPQEWPLCQKSIQDQLEGVASNPEDECGEQGRLDDITLTTANELPSGQQVGEINDKLLEGNMGAAEREVQGSHAVLGVHDAQQQSLQGSGCEISLETLQSGSSSRQPTALPAEQVKADISNELSWEPPTSTPPSASVQSNPKRLCTANALGASFSGGSFSGATGRKHIIHSQSAPLLAAEVPADASQEKMLEGTRHSSESFTKQATSSSCNKIKEDDNNDKDGEVLKDTSQNTERQISPLSHLHAQALWKHIPKFTRKKFIFINPHSRHLTRALYAPDRDTPHPKHKTLHASRSNIPKAEDRTFVQKVVFDNKFDLVTGGIIVANALVFALKLQHDGFDVEHSIAPGVKTAAEAWPGSAKAFEVIEYIFTIVFVGELLLRICADTLRNNLRSGWMWFDTTIVVLGVVDTFGAGALGMNTSIMRLFRLVRLVRLLKIFQSLQTFDSLFLLIKAVQASVTSMAYSFLMVLVIQVVLGMFMCQTLQAVIMNESYDMETRQDLFKYWGTFSHSMLTMFEITLANWIPSCRALVGGVSEWWMLFYIFYRCMFCFALIKVIAAVFITETNRVLASDDELVLMKQRREKLAYTHKLTNMFESMDLDGDGYLAWNELQKLLADEQTAEFLTTLGFQQHDFEKLFWLIDEGDGKIPIKDFVSKVGKLKGISKSIDTLTLLKLAHRIEMVLHDVFEKQGLIKHTRGCEDEEVFNEAAGDD